MPEREHRPRRAPRPAESAPDAAALREAALAHLARFAATEAGLRRVLERRVDRWARRAEAEGAARDAVAAQAGEARRAAAEVARAMTARAGRSRRAIAAHLAAKGVAAAVADAALPEGPEAELDAALAFCRRRRIGPFAAAAPDPAARLKALGALARAGFARGVAERVLDLDADGAEERLLASRRA